MKTCTLCLVSKEETEFHRNKNGLFSRCKQCRNFLNRQYGEKNKENIKIRKRKYRLNNKDKLKQYREKNKEKIALRQKYWYEKNSKRILSFHKTIEGKFASCRRTAKRKNLNFLLSFEEFCCLVGSLCFYCGDRDKIGIDRIDSFLGYVQSNCVPCCEMCNYMKNDYAQNKFLNQVSKIYQHYYGCGL